MKSNNKHVFRQYFKEIKTKFYFKISGNFVNASKVIKDILALSYSFLLFNVLIAVDIMRIN